MTGLTCKDRKKYIRDIVALHSLSKYVAESFYLANWFYMSVLEEVEKVVSLPIYELN